MNTRSLAVLLLFAIFASPFSAFAVETELPIEEVIIEETIPVEEIIEEELIGEILATSTEAVVEELTVAQAEEPEEIPEESKIEPVDPIDPDTYVPGEVIVVFEDAVEEEHIASIETVDDIDSIESLSQESVMVETDAPIEQAIAELSALPDVAFVEPNYIRSIDAFTAWSLDTIDAPEAQTIATGTDVIIAVIDTGVDYTHPDLAGHMWDGTNCVASTSEPISGGCTHGYDFAGNDADPMAEGSGTSYFHGTHVAGIVAGVAPGAKIMAIRFGLTVSSEVEAIRFAMANGATIINASYSGAGDSDTERAVIAEFEATGGLFIAAASNDGTDNDATPKYPASHNLDSVISVTATDITDELWASSNFGGNSVDLGAPGTGIRSTYPGGLFAIATGTSMAAPHVAATVALVKQQFPNLDADGIKERVLTTGDALPALQGKTVSGKRLNANRALTLDFNAPVITLLGANPMTLTVGETFTDPGATATDDFDGEISASIATSSTVNTAVAGSYEVTYVVSDVQNNTATSTRAVTIQAPPAPSGGGGGGGGGGGSKKNKDKKKEVKKEVKKTPKKKIAPVATSTPPVADPVRLPQSTGSVLGASSTPAFFFTLNLGVGSTGNEVLELQKKLVTLGYLTVAPTGYYGLLTQGAVMKFQAAKSIPMLGIIGPMTRAALNATP